jgi:nucleoside-diphosphate-sugar epimerase
MINIFITGANSLLGTNLIELLCQRNYNVYALVRSKSKYHGKQYNNLFLIESNLFDDLSQYLKKCTILVHIAAETRQHLHSARHYDKINFYATKSIFETAQQCHVKRMIMISTANTFYQIILRSKQIKSRTISQNQQQRNRSYISASDFYVRRL